MNKWILLMLSTLLLAVACSNKDETAIDETITITDTSVEEDVSAPVMLEVALNTVNVRKSPSMNSSVVAKLPAGSKVEWQHQISEVTAPVKLRGIRYNDPWLYVKISDDQMGWVYAATINVKTNNKAGQALMQQIVARRITSFFGSELSTAISNYNQAYVEASDSERFANVYTYGQGLRDQLVAVLDKKTSATGKALADMRWLDSLLAGYSHTVLNGKRYYLYADFQQMRRKAQQTQGDEDNKFIAFIAKVFANGKETPKVSGVDKSVLSEIDELTTTIPPFKDALTTLRTRLSAQ